MFVIACGCVPCHGCRPCHNRCLSCLACLAALVTTACLCHGGLLDCRVGARLWFVGRRVDTCLALAVCIPVGGTRMRVLACGHMPCLPCRSMWPACHCCLPLPRQPACCRLGWIPLVVCGPACGHMPCPGCLRPSGRDLDACAGVWTHALFALPQHVPCLSLLLAFATAACLLPFGLDPTCGLWAGVWTRALPWLFASQWEGLGCVCWTITCLATDVCFLVGWNPLSWMCVLACGHMPCLPCSSMWPACHCCLPLPRQFAAGFHVGWHHVGWNLDSRWTPGWMCRRVDACLASAVCCHVGWKPTWMVVGTCPANAVW